MENITNEIVQIIEQLKTKVLELEELGYEVEITSLPDSNRYGSPKIKVYKPITID